LTIASIQYDRVVNIQTVTDYGAAGSPGAGRFDSTELIEASQRLGSATRFRLSRMPKYELKLRNLLSCRGE